MTNRLKAMSDTQLAETLTELRPLLEQQQADADDSYELRKNVWVELRRRGWTFAAMGELSGLTYQLPARCWREYEEVNGR